MDRSKLPYRKNCEGYFLYGENQILGRDTGKGYVEFPGGGVEDNETSEAMARETLEETGATIEYLQQVNLMHFDWDPGWPKTDKQRARYEIFRGEEMHMFIGRVAEIGEPTGDPEHSDSGWEGNRLMTLEEAVSAIEGHRPFAPEMEAFHLKQIEIIKNLPIYFSQGVKT